MEHNPENPNWTPKLGRRRYQCTECQLGVVLETNHTGSCYPLCKGQCRYTVNNTRLRKQTKHVYLGEIK